MIRICLLTALCLFPLAASGDVFVDDFSRPDGPLESPWTLLDQELLYIESGRVVANASEFGLMAYYSPCLSSEVSLEADFSFGGDSDQGRFQLFIGGGTSDEDAHGFAAIIEIDQFRIRWFLPEVDLVFGSYAFSPLTLYKMRLHYAAHTQLITLTIMDENGDPLDEIQATQATDDLHLCAVGLENSAQARKWADNVRFEYSCDVLSAPQTVAPPLVVEVRPNPVSRLATISFTLATGQGVEVSIFDATGRHIAHLMSRTLPAGAHGMTWNGRDDLGRAVAPGTYLVRVMADQGLHTRKLTLLR